MKSKMAHQIKVQKRFVKIYKEHENATMDDRYFV